MNSLDRTVSRRRTRTRIVHGCIALGLAATSLVGAPRLLAHANGSCINDPALDALNPVVAQSDLTAEIDVSRPWADISGAVCGNDAAAVLATVKGNVTEASFNIPLAAPIPNFPTPGGDTGITFEACSDMNGPLAAGPTQIGVGHRGEPIFDGPYPPSQGWRYCTYASLQVAAPLDYGVEIVDPVGDSMFVDFVALRDTAGNATITAPLGIAPGSNQVTLYLPDTLVYQVDAVAPPFRGLPHNFVEPFLAPMGGTGVVGNASVFTKMVIAVTLPFPICVNTSPPGIGCNGSQTIGPILGVAAFDDRPSDWAPGSITCPFFPNVTSCAPGNGGNPAAVHNGYDLGLAAIPAVPTCANPLFPGPPTPPANNPLVTCAALNGAYTYFPCQPNSVPDGQDQGDATIATGGCPVPIGPAIVPYAYASEYGRVTPSMLPTVDNFTVGPTALPDGWSF